MSVFPPELTPPIADLDDYATVILRRGFYSDAIRIQKARYGILKAVEKIASKRIHKGSPLHMLGFCHSITDPDSALQYYAAAHVEDVLSEGPLRAKLYSSYYVLSRGYLIPEEFIDKFDNLIQQVQVRTAIPDPFDVLKTFESSSGSLSSQMKVSRAPRLVFPKLKLDEITRTDESKRVFLGGAFNNILYLKQIENVVNELGYYTVFADNFEKPATMDDDEFTRTLLKYSRYAIFE